MGASLSSLSFKTDMLLRSATGWFTAIANGSVDIVRNNREKFAGQVNDDGDSGLHVSIAKRDRDIAELLAPLEGGVQNANGETLSLSGTGRRYSLSRHSHCCFSA